MKITVVGCGRWGSFIAWYLNKTGHSITTYGIPGEPTFDAFVNNRTNGIVTFGDEINLSSDPEKSLTEADAVVISINSQNLRSFLTENGKYISKDKIIILCMKGLEIDTGKRLTEIVEEFLPENKVAIWVGPGHPQEFVLGYPNCMVIDSKDQELVTMLVSEFSSSLIRFYYGTDLIGNEVGAASKNVIGIAAGILDGLSRSSLKGALMSRGTREIARLIKAMGGNEMTAYGLSHLGDYEATVFSKYSHNRMFGETLVKGEKYTSLAEGYYTVKAMMTLKDKYSVELPICEAVYNTIYNGTDINSSMAELFMRSVKNEF
ncbi:MAG: glycerol-3-phosphate dehydrogenase [Clostridiales bacterium]|nr:MAG: glycerol-3-phosphate dehydrogenase [Clostridiales bacterium]